MWTEATRGTRTLTSALLCLLSLLASLGAAEPEAARVHAWYRSENLQTNGARVTAWKSEEAPGRSLTRVVGKPVALRVATADGERTVLRLDGKSALWQPANAWGSLAGGRTVVAYVRLAPKAAGVLFDGSTNGGMTRAQVRDGSWQAGVQPPPISNADAADPGTHPAQTGVWQVHAFTFRTTAQGTDITHRIGTGEAKVVSMRATAPLGGFILGANAATRRGLACDVAELLVHDRALDDAEVAAASAYLVKKWGAPTDLPTAQQPKDASVADDPRVFRTVLRQSGDDGAHTYRIPGLTTTKAGTLLAVFDVRHANSGDLPGDIDVGLCRSTDGGTKWEPMQRVLDFPKDEPGARGNGVGDPCIVADQQTGAVFVAALWSKGNRAWVGSGPGMTPDETGQFVIARSDDDGKTWSPPVNITAQVKRPEWRLCFVGPGRGIQTRDGTLVLPAQFIDAEKVPHSFFIFSEDHGRTWQPSPPAVATTSVATTEAQVEELPGGEILISMRNHDPRRERAWAAFRRNPATGKLAGGSWSPVWFVRDDPVCMASLVNHPQSGALLFANPATKGQRARMTVSLSRDGGRTWPASRLLDARPSAYSCLTVLPDGAIGLLYETGDASSYETLTFARFPIDWLTDKGGAKSAEPTSSLKLSPAFSDHMVLQGGLPVPVWGTARAGAGVTVTFGGQTKATTASTSGEWRIVLEPLTASAVGRSMSIASEAAKVGLTDLLVGEVWLAAGQSNMEFPLRQSTGAKEAMEMATRADIRLFTRQGAARGASGVYTPAMIRDLDVETFCTGQWQTASPQNVGDFSAVAWHFGARLADELKVPVGLIDVSIGGTPTEAWIRRGAMEAHPQMKELVKGNWLRNPAIDAWCRDRAGANFKRAFADGDAIPGDEFGPNHSFKPGFMWDAAMLPLMPFAVRGVIWYQGESNAETAERVPQHAQLFPLLIQDWRAQWGRAELPFGFVQLPAMDRTNWPAFRETQRRVPESIPHTGMAVTIDTGDRKNVHPPLKKPAGERLALWALANVYGRPLAFSGPQFRNVERAGERLVVKFGHAQGMRAKNDAALTGFEIAGADGAFVPASATVEADTVIVQSAAVKSPLHVRYGWQPFPEPPLNLTNAAGLPASPFTTLQNAKP